MDTVSTLAVTCLFDSDSNFPSLYAPIVTIRILPLNVFALLSRSGARFMIRSKCVLIFVEKK
jgi:hypothetical protein